MSPQPRYSGRVLKPVLSNRLGRIIDRARMLEARVLNETHEGATQSKIAI